MAPVRPEEELEGIGAMYRVEEGSNQGEETSEEACDQDEESLQAGEEGEEVKVKRAPNQPSEKELQDHMVTHVPFRPWCPFCVAGKSKANPHRRR